MTLKGINHSPKKKNTRKTADTTDTAFYEISWDVITDWRVAHRLGEIPATTARTSDPQKQPSPTKCRLCCPQGCNHLWGLESIDSVSVCVCVCACVRTRRRAHAHSLSPVQLFSAPWTVAYQAPLSMGFSRQEYWRGCRFLLQGIFPTQGWNFCLLHLLKW